MASFLLSRLLITSLQKPTASSQDPRIALSAFGCRLREESCNCLPRTPWVVSLASSTSQPLKKKGGLGTLPCAGRRSQVHKLSLQVERDAAVLGQRDDRVPGFHPVSSSRSCRSYRSRRHPWRSSKEGNLSQPFKCLHVQPPFYRCLTIHGVSLFFTSNMDSSSSRRHELSFHVKRDAAVYNQREDCIRKLRKLRGLSAIEVHHYLAIDQPHARATPAPALVVLRTHSSIETDSDSRMDGSACASSGVVKVVRLSGGVPVWQCGSLAGPSLPGPPFRLKDQKFSFAPLGQILLRPNLQRPGSTQATPTQARFYSSNSNSGQVLLKQLQLRPGSTQATRTWAKSTQAKKTDLGQYFCDHPKCQDCHPRDLKTKSKT